MKQLKIIILLIFIIIVSLSCADKSTKKSYREIMEQFPVFHLENYPFFNPESPLAQRITPAPDFVLDYLKGMDGVDDYRVYIPTDTETALCAEYLEKLPEVHKKTLKERLVGIFFIENFIGSGMADFVLDKEENIYCTLFINPETMKKDMTSWLTYRENSCFIKEEHDVSIVQDCGTGYTGLMYILLHETTHIVDYIHSITPYIGEAIKEICNKTLTQTPFTKGIWETYETPEGKYNFNRRSGITFYGLRGGPKINIDEAEGIYRDCTKTPFTSLYATWNWAEDWAEFVTWYYLTNTLNQPYEIRVYKDGTRIHSFRPMEGEKVKERIPVVRGILDKVAEEY